MLNGSFPLGQPGGGFRHGWRQLTGADATLDQEPVTGMAGRFSRRVHAYAKRRHLPLRHCGPGGRKHELAEQVRPTDPTVTGGVLIRVAKAPARVWEVVQNAGGVPPLRRKTPWPSVNHDHSPSRDQDWGHLTLQVSGHPPCGVQVLRNGHEGVERRARKRRVPSATDGNGFVAGSDVPAVDRLAATRGDGHGIDRLATGCERWVDTSCVGFGLTRAAQPRSGFHSEDSGSQLESSRNRLLTRGTVLEAGSPGRLDRTRRALAVPTLRTLCGAQHRPHRRHGSNPGAPRRERVVAAATHDLTVLQRHCGRRTLKRSDKGARVLRIEGILPHGKVRRCGQRLEQRSLVLAKLQRRVIGFLNVVYAAHRGPLQADALDTWPLPPQRGTHRRAGVEAVRALAPKPEGFTAPDVAAKVRPLLGAPGVAYTPRQAASDPAKLRGTPLVARVPATRRYQAPVPGVQILAALLILREKGITPVLAGVCTPPPGPTPKRPHPLDVHYANLHHARHRTFETLGLAA